MTLNYFLPAVIFLVSINFSIQDYYDILRIPKTASDTEIKKSYRKLALELHPDKISQNTTEAERELMIKLFLEIQNAYEVLGSEESRLKYDLSSQGIEYAVREEKEQERYTSRYFSLYAKNKRMKMYFQATFEKKKIPEIILNIPISIRETFNEFSGNVTFYRSVICPFCKGNGGLNGSCSTCTFCVGQGHANHVHHSHDHDQFQQMTNTRCAVCEGKGCKPDGQCPICKGSGFKMEETKVPYTLPKGFPDQAVGSYKGFGHQDLDGDIGDVTIKFTHVYPPHWKRESPQSLNLVHEVLAPYADMVKGFKSSIFSLIGEKIEV